jgi:DNA topoisomerase-1
MAQGDVMKLIKLDPTQHFTKPPARYSEASLVKEMEKAWHRSSFDLCRDHFDHSGSRLRALHNRRFYSEKMGDIVTERLSESFSNLMDYGFTAGMEENLDDVAKGERDWKTCWTSSTATSKKTRSSRRTRKAACAPTSRS